MPKSAIDADKLEALFKKHAQSNKKLYDNLSEKSEERKTAFVAKMDKRHLEQRNDK